MMLSKHWAHGKNYGFGVNMTASDLVKQVMELNEKAPEGVVEGIDVMLLHPGSMVHVPAKLTLTYTSRRMAGTTKFEQVPIILVEEDRDE